GEVAKKLGVSLPVDDYETFGGWVFSCYGFIPKDGTEFELDASTLHIKVVEIKDHRIEEAIIIAVPPIDDPVDSITKS
ncbi:MAG: transporter associated domain-containing protein, partial [Lachnospiraceae bacterium]